MQTCATENPSDNLERQIALLRDAASKGANVLCTQELFLTPYFCQSEDHSFFALAEQIPSGKSTRAFCALAAELGVVIVASLFEKRMDGLYHNTAIVVDADGTYLGSYRKMHIPDDPLFYEKFYFAPGDLGYRVWRTRFATIGVLICWDQWYPEAARLTALQGAQVLFYPTAIGWHPAEKEHHAMQHAAWETIQRSHAIANGCYVASVNRVGHEKGAGGGDGIVFWGQSFVSDPSGQMLAKADHENECVLVVDADLSKIDETRTHWPFFRDRRIDSYGEITRRAID